MQKGTLVVLLGNARGGELTWDSMKKHLLEPYDADLALAFGHTSELPASLTSQARYTWIMQEPHDWGEIYDLCAQEHGIVNWREKCRNARKTGLFGGVIMDGKRLAGSGAIIFGMRHWLVKTQLPILSTYETVILTRSDHMYACDHPVVRPVLNEVCVVKGEDYDGITDRHHIFCGKDAKKAIDIVSFIVQHLQPNSNSNPERAVKSYFDHVGLHVTRFSRCMYTVARENEQSSWSVGRLDVGGGLWSKYPSEYNTSSEYCASEPQPLMHCSKLGHFPSAIVIFFVTLVVVVILFVSGFVLMKNIPSRQNHRKEQGYSIHV